MKHFLTSNKVTKAEKDAFLRGCRAMIEVYAHADDDFRRLMTTRNDPDWILYLLEKHDQVSKRERQEVAKAILANYHVDQQEIRGLFLGCARLNDQGEEVDDNNQPCEPREYPYVRYRNQQTGEDITAEEFDLLTTVAQAQYEKEPLIKLTSGSGQVRYHSPYDSALVELILKDHLSRGVTMPMAKRYAKALEDGDNELIQMYSEHFEKVAEAVDDADEFKDTLRNCGLFRQFFGIKGDSDAGEQGEDDSEKENPDTENSDTEEQDKDGHKEENPDANAPENAGDTEHDADGLLKPDYC